jgi:curved DNA-binding protein
MKNCPNSLMNYYTVLGLPRTASCEDIKNTYRKLAMKNHPKNNPTEEAQKKFILINEAYNALSSEFKR